MQRAFLAIVACLIVSACAYRPTPTEVIRIVDSPADVRTCVRLGEVSGPVTSGPGFGAVTQGMLEATVALGGTDLLLARSSPSDWSVVRGIAYRCDGVQVERGVVLSVRG